MSNLKFNGAHGTKPSTQARSYVRGVLATMLDAAIRSEDEHTRYWFLGGITEEPDQRRVLGAMRRLQEQLRHRASAE